MTEHPDDFPLPEGLRRLGGEPQEPQPHDTQWDDTATLPPQPARAPHPTGASDGNQDSGFRDPAKPRKPGRTFGTTRSVLSIIAALVVGAGAGTGVSAVVASNQQHQLRQEHTQELNEGVEKRNELRSDIRDLENEVAGYEASEAEAEQRQAELDEREEALTKAEEEKAAADKKAAEEAKKKAAAEKKKQEQEQKEAQAKTKDGDGLYLIGEDMQPGTWRSSGGNRCYWERLRGTSGEFRDIIANDNPAGDTVVTISSSDAAFSSSRCGTWTKIG